MPELFSHTEAANCKLQGFKAGFAGTGVYFCWDKTFSSPQPDHLLHFLRSRLALRVGDSFWVVSAPAPPSARPPLTARNSAARIPCRNRGLYCTILRRQWTSQRTTDPTETWGKKAVSLGKGPRIRKRGRRESEGMGTATFGLAKCLEKDGDVATSSGAL